MTEHNLYYILNKQEYSIFCNMMGKSFEYVPDVQSDFIDCEQSGEFKSGDNCVARIEKENNRVINPTSEALKIIEIANKLSKQVTDLQDSSESRSITFDSHINTADYSEEKNLNRFNKFFTDIEGNKTKVLGIKDKNGNQIYINYDRENPEKLHSLSYSHDFHDDDSSSIRFHKSTFKFPKDTDFPVDEARNFVDGFENPQQADVIKVDSVIDSDDKPDLSNWSYSKGYSYEGIYGDNGVIQKLLYSGCEVNTDPTTSINFIRKDDKIVGMIDANSSLNQTAADSTFNLYLDQNIVPEDKSIFLFKVPISSNDLDAISELIIAENNRAKTNELVQETTAPTVSAATEVPPAPSAPPASEPEEKSNWVQGLIGTAIAAASGIFLWSDNKDEKNKKEDENKGFSFKKATVALCAVLGTVIALDAGVNQGKWCSYVKNSVMGARDR